MPASSKQAGVFHYALVASWLFFTFAAGAYLVQRDLVPFDPQMRLSDLSAVEAREALAPVLEKTGESHRGQVIHFSSARCRCNKMSLRHKSAIDRLATDEGLKVVDYRLNGLTGSLPVPSVPAIAIIDEKGKLAYLGPYAQGLGCGGSESLVEVVMNNLRHGFNPELIMGAARGCYCNL